MSSWKHCERMSAYFSLSSRLVRNYVFNRRFFSPFLSENQPLLFFLSFFSSTTQIAGNALQLLSAQGGGVMEGETCKVLRGRERSAELPVFVSALQPVSLFFQKVSWIICCFISGCLSTILAALTFTCGKPAVRLCFRSHYC